MGISGLLPLLKEIQVNGHVSEFKGKRLAVDAYVWLHKGAFGCAEELVKGKKTTKFVDYAMHRVRLLRYHGITPFIVFDGGPLPAKKGTEVSRAKSRAENMDRAKAFEAQGRWKDARDCYTKCVDITPKMAYQLIKALRAENVDYVVAPYEADAQLCFLEREGFVDGIITEDSDLLVFGCKRVIFKLDGNGHCVWIHRDKLAQIREFPMHGWTDTQFRRMAMLSGCDYLDSIPGIGLKTAHRLLRRFNTVEKLLQHIRLEGVMQIPSTYLADFAQAELAFIHQRVFHPHQGKLIPLNDFPEGGLQEADERWIGLDLEEHIAKGVARGDLHPETRLPIVDEWPEYMPVARAKPFGESSKANIVVSAGPMDAFITKTKRSKVLPRPVGTFGSGPSRLSDQQTIPDRTFNPLKRVDDDNASTPNGQGKTSKFFSSRSRRVSTPEPKVELNWESSDGAEPEAGPSQSRSLSARSPSPAISSIRAEDSPAKSIFSDAHILTSPMAPALSSPACSSPTGIPFSTPRRKKGTRSVTPGSPTGATNGDSVLIASSSQILDRTQSIRSSQIITQTPKSGGGRLMSKLTSVLVPGSSPMNSFVLPNTFTDAKPNVTRRLAQNSSSDTIEEDEVVTPSIESGVRKKRKRVKEAVEVEEEIDEQQREREERARIVSEGWRAKYAFGSQSSSSPISEPREVFAIKRTKSDPAPKRVIAETPKPKVTKRTSLPISARAPRVLGDKPINTLAAGMERTPVLVSTKLKKERQRSPGADVENFGSDRIISPTPSPEPEAKRIKSYGMEENVAVKEGRAIAGSTWAKLERFKFAGKVTMK
ncbi:hypothetical protein CI109_100074 [Kwoniella shandongensis]|uniref:Uncharacterized protein n=1 Tax=Kwoniella shandongensis TaxID=1734106 RepID=A0A5M6BVQ8_9TREE|nr:uncharacterized protein CI109_005953 [Kwoniella shandongensis]KAA5525645.1 hypothetical protein CI109_005953 [Kwoniella shandongensis]